MPKAILSTKAAPAPKQPVSVITCDMEGRIETFSDGAEQIFGYGAGEVVGKRRVSLFSPGEVWLTSAETGRTFHAGHLNGEVLTASCYPS